MYLVYDNTFGEISPICVCGTTADAEEMCLALAEESYYNHRMLYLQINRTSFQTLSTLGHYNYKEVPFVG